VSPSSHLLGNSNDQFAEVAPFQHAGEGFGRVLQTVNEVLAVADVAIGDAGTDFAQECGIVLGGKFAVDETAHCQALRQDLAHGGGQPVGAVALSHAAILRDQATDRDARELIEQRQHGLPDRPTDVLEVDINAVRADRRQLGGQRSDRSTRRRDDHRFPGRGLTDHAQTAIRGEPGHPEYAERRRDRRDSRIELAQVRDPTA